MDIFVLIGKRKERYDGQYAPEALAVIDEYGNDENPDYLLNELKKYTDSEEFLALTIIKLRVSDLSIKNALFPVKNVIPADVITVFKSYG